MPPKVHRGCFYVGPIEPEQQALPAPNHTLVDNHLSNGKRQHSDSNRGKRRKKSRLWDDNVSEFRVITNTANSSSSSVHIPDLQPQLEQNQLEATIISFEDGLSQPIADIQENFDTPGLLSPIELRLRTFPQAAHASTLNATLEEAVEGLLDLRTRPHTWVTTPYSSLKSSFDPVGDFSTEMPSASVTGLESSPFLMDVDATDMPVLTAEPSTSKPGDSICMKDFNTPRNSPPEEDTTLESVIPRVYKPATPRVKSVESVLDVLRNASMGLLEFLSLVLEAPESSFAYYRSSFYSEHSSSRLSHLFNLIWKDEKGHEALKTWMFPHALKLICEKIHLEMEDTKPLLQMSTNDVTPEFIENFDVENIMEPAAKNTPVWTQILTAATESKESLNKIKTSRSRNRAVVCDFYLHVSSFMFDV